MLNWPETERQLAANTAMAFEAWKLEKQAEMHGAKK